MAFKRKDNSASGILDRALNGSLERQAARAKAIKARTGWNAPAFTLGKRQISKKMLVISGICILLFAVLPRQAPLFNYIFGPPPAGSLFKPVPPPPPAPELKTKLPPAPPLDWNKLLHPNYQSR